MNNKDKLAINGGLPIRSRASSMVKPYGDEEIQAVMGVMQKGTVSCFRGGEYVKKFEKEFADYIGVPYAIATTSGTTALHTAIAALNLPPKSMVAVPALTFVSTASVVVQEGLIPVFIDVDSSFCMEPNDLRKKITPRMRAVIPVHLYGHPARMDEINEIAKANTLYVIEDACQSHGATHKGKKTGSLGDIGCFSFYESKNMTCGEGGMITVKSKELYDQLRLKREHGSPYTSSTWYCYNTLGYNYNMTNLQAAIGLEQLKKLNKNNHHRMRIAELYRNVLKGLDLTFIHNRVDCENVSHNFPVLLPEHLKSKRDFFVEALRAEGIPTDIAYPFPLYEAELFRGLETKECFKTKDVTSRLFTLFTDNAIDVPLVEDTGKAIKKILNSLKEEK